MSENVFEICLPAVRESLNEFYTFFRDVSEKLQLNNQIHFDIELSIEEALTNVISHAYRDGEIGDFVLRIADHVDWVEITIQDWGQPFDPSEVKPFDYNAPVETRINGGMGLHFMRTLMDNVEYHFDEHNGTVLTMTKDREPVAANSPMIDERVERELQVFDAVARALSTERNANALLDLIVDKLTDVVAADRGTLYLVDAERGELYSKILQDETGRLTQIRLQIGEGVAGYVAETGETVNITDADADPHFMRSFDRSSGYQTETMLCTPMRNAGGDIIGVIQLLNKRGGVFTRRDEIILGVLASQAAIAIENARLLASEQDKRRIADTLREVSSIINSSLELDEVLELILQQVEHVVPFDTASVLLIEDGMLVARAGRGFEKALPERLPLFAVQDNPLMREMLETQKAIIISNVQEDERWVRSNHTPEKMRSWLGTPLIVDGRVIGELSINHTHADIYRSHHANTIMTFANQAATAIERARLYEQTILQARLQQEVDTARTIQTSFLPDSAPPTPGWQIAPSWEPAKEVAGDFYDFIALDDNRVGFVVADVCGKGIPASLYMALSRTTLRVMAQTDLSPDVLLERVNNQLKADSASNLFVTVFYGVLQLNTGELIYANGGHNPPFLYLPGETELLELASDGPALGVFPGVGFELGRTTMPTGSILVAYTDGVTEAIDNDEQEFGEAGLKDCIFRYAKQDAVTINLKIRQDVKAFMGERPPEDDATILIIKRT